MISCPCPLTQPYLKRYWPYTPSGFSLCCSGTSNGGVHSNWLKPIGVVAIVPIAARQVGADALVDDFADSILPTPLSYRSSLQPSHRGEYSRSTYLTVVVHVV
jgi:hypothetical protein